MVSTELNNVKRMKCIAVDDEPFALELMADDIRKIPFLELIAVCSSAAEASTLLEKQKVDLLFLDIQMPSVLGTQFLRNLTEPPMVIFATAYEQYALEGFELDVIDYLVKPIPFARLEKAANKAWEQFNFRNESVESGEKFFFVRAEYKEIKILFDDILYIEGLKDYVKIFLASQPRPIFTRLNLKAIESRLPEKQFCRVHNSFIVSMPKISSIQKSQLFIQKIVIPIGDRHAKEFRAKYGALE